MEKKHKWLVGLMIFLIPVTLSFVAFLKTPVVLTDDQALQLRTLKIQKAAIELAWNPNWWQVAPANCRQSMTQIMIFKGDDSLISSGSASLIQALRTVDEDDRVVWIYRLLTAHHVLFDDKGHILDGDIVILPGSYTDQNYRFQFWDYVQFADTEGINEDLVMITVFGIGDSSEIGDPNFIPLGIESVLPFDGTKKEAQYFSFDYPGVTGKPQFTQSIFGGEGIVLRDGEKQIMKPTGESSTIAAGSSGGAVCNSTGQHVGVISGIVGNWPSDFFIEENPANIAEQIDRAIARSLVIWRESLLKW